MKAKIESISVHLTKSEALELWNACYEVLGKFKFEDRKAKYELALKSFEDAVFRALFGEAR